MMIQRKPLQETYYKLKIKGAGLYFYFADK
jgi:hypothetical protein